MVFDNAFDNPQYLYFVNKLHLKSLKPTAVHCCRAPLLFKTIKTKSVNPCRTGCKDPLIPQTPVVSSFILIQPQIHCHAAEYNYHTCVIICCRKQTPTENLSLPLWVTFAKNYSGHLLRKTTEPFKKTKLYIYICERFWKGSSFSRTIGLDAECNTEGGRVVYLVYTLS